MHKIFFTAVLLFITAGYSFSQELRATWIARNSISNKETLARTIDSLASANFNVIYINVWSRGYPLWKSEVFNNHTGVYIDPVYNGRDILAEAIAEAHKHGMHVEAWFEYGFVGGWTGNQPPGAKGPIFEAHPNWVAKKQNGGEIDNSNFYWMVHTREDVQNFIIDLCKEMALNYDLDGIELDRIRYSSLEYGYDEYTDSLYKAEHGGVSPPTNISDPTWIRWRANKLNEFMVKAYDSIKTINPHINISNAPSLYSSGSYTAYNSFCQDWVGWLQQGSVDNVQVQSYVASPSAFSNILDYIISIVPDLTKVYPSFAINPGGNQLTQSQINEFITITRNKGFKGNSIWYFTDLLPHFTFLRNGLYSEKVYPPHSSYDWREYYDITTLLQPNKLTISGNWLSSTIFGYTGLSLYTDNTSAAEIIYSFNVPVAGYYEVYVYNVTSVNRTDSARITITDNSGSQTTTFVNQIDNNKRRWVKLGDFELQEGNRNVIKIDNSNLTQGKLLSADATMIKLNRRLSPEVVTGMKSEGDLKKKSDNRLRIYPNPFREETTVDFFTETDSEVILKIIDINGRTLDEINIIPKNIGHNVIKYKNTKLASGIYFIYLKIDNMVNTEKMVLLK